MEFKSAGSTVRRQIICSSLLPRFGNKLVFIHHIPRCKKYGGMSLSSSPSAFSSVVPLSSVSEPGISNPKSIKSERRPSMNEKSAHDEAN